MLIWFLSPGEIICLGAINLTWNDMYYSDRKLMEYLKIISVKSYKCWIHWTYFEVRQWKCMLDWRIHSRQNCFRKAQILEHGKM